MSILLADIDATCAALGFNDGEKYNAEPDAIQGLKHLIWILRRDLENHEYRRHLGRANVLQTDLIPMLPDYIDDDEYSDVLIRLLVILTNPTLLLYREGGIPKDNLGRKIYIELIDILQGYKEGFTTQRVWAALALKLHKALDVDWSLRSEEQGLIIERILVLVRNVLQVPAKPEIDCLAGNDASVHDQVIWALFQSGLLDLILYILGSTDENQYHLHALEIICLLYKEQNAASLADASLQRSNEEKQRDEQELIAARRREKQKLLARPPPHRHLRYGGTFVLQNVKSISDRDIICHRFVERAADIDLDRGKKKQRRSHRVVSEDNVTERRSAFSVRLFLREMCIEILKSAYNTLVREIRRLLERNSGSGNHDDSYLLWAIRFFMEFNRLSGLDLHLVSESLSVQCFHWVLTRMQHDLDMIITDKNQARLWARRLHIAVQTFRELLLSLLALQKLKDDKANALFDMLINNVCYILEYRETILHLLMNYNEAHSTKAYLRDVIETANIFTKMMEKFCKDTAFVQQKKRGGRRTQKNKKNKKSQNAEKNLDDPENFEELENKWAELSNQITEMLANSEMINLAEEEQPIPFDAALEKSIDDQKEDCMKRIHGYLRGGKSEHAICLMRAAREVWPENDHFGATLCAPEDELMILREIFFANLGNKEPKEDDAGAEDPDDEDESDNVDSEEEEETRVVETTFKFEDFMKKLINPKVVRACTIVLSDFEKISTKSLKAAVTILHRIAYGSKFPAMLYQAILFRIFQRVLDAPREPHHEELRRLAIYVIRKFVETAPSNPKIYAELLFYKTMREANELEMGYCDAYDAGTKGTWSDEQEEELRKLFEENQNNPESDRDVIDWILDNLIDKTRTRRGVLKKLKEMGLIFKAPTKKSSAAANKNLWQYEEDEQLRQLYDEHRRDDSCLNKIMEVMGDKRSKRAIIKRMLEIHLIADKSEILPSKRGKKSRQRSNSESSSTGSDSDGWITSRNQIHKNLKKTRKQVTRKVIRNPLDIDSLKLSLSAIDENLKSALEWLIESLEEAYDDADEGTNEAENDGIPLFPIQQNQILAIENENFQKILINLGLVPPQEASLYWKIPGTYNKNDIKLRIKALKDEPIDDTDIVYDEIIEYESEEETVPAAPKQKQSKKKQARLLDKLIKKPKKPKTRKIKKNPLDVSTVRSLIFQIDDKFKDAIEWLAESLSDAADDTEEANDEDDGIPLLPMLEVQKDAMEDEYFKKLLIGLGMQQPIQDVETYWRIPVYLKPNDLKKRAQLLRGQEIEGEADDPYEFQNEEDENTSDAAEESDKDTNNDRDNFDNYVKNQRKKMDSLVYGASENEDEPPRKPLKKTKRETVKKSKPIGKDSSDEDYFEKKAKSISKPKNDKKITKNAPKKKGAINMDDMILSNSENVLELNPDHDFETENLRLRLAELSDESDNEVRTESILTKKRMNVIESDEEDNNKNESVTNTNSDQKTTNVLRRRRNIIDSDSDEPDIQLDSNEKKTKEIDSVNDEHDKSKEKNSFDSFEEPNYSLQMTPDKNDFHPKSQTSAVIIENYHSHINLNKSEEIQDDQYGNKTVITSSTITSTTNIHTESSHIKNIFDELKQQECTTITISADNHSIGKSKDTLDDGLDSLTESSQTTASIKKITKISMEMEKSELENVNQDDFNSIGDDGHKMMQVDITKKNIDGIEKSGETRKKHRRNDLLGSDDDDDDNDDDIIVKRRKIDNEKNNDENDKIDDENEDDEKINSVKNRTTRIGRIIDDDDDDDE